MAMPPGSNVFQWINIIRTFEEGHLRTFMQNYFQTGQVVFDMKILCSQKFTLSKKKQTYDVKLNTKQHHCIRCDFVAR